MFYFIFSPKSCGDGRVASAAGADTLGAVSTQTCTQADQELGSLSSGPKQQKGGAAFLSSNEQPSLGSLCSPPSMRNGQNKRLSRNIDCFRSPRPAHRGWRGIPSRGRKIEKKRPTGKSETKKLKTKTTVLNFGSWNVRTLLDNAKADRHNRITALVARTRTLQCRYCCPK